MKILDFNDEAAEININKYLVPRLYAAVIIIDKTVYKFLSESFKKLLIRLQREDIFI